MATMIDIPTFEDERGCLSIIEKIENFDIKRVFYIYNTDRKRRGEHRHKKTKQILICINGSCDVICQFKDKSEETFHLCKPQVGLRVEPEDWHMMENFSDDCILMVLASEFYEENDYVLERY